MSSRRLCITAAALVLVACASTTLRDAWIDPDHRAGAYRKVVVLGVSSDIPDRRIFEDVMVQKIAGTGAEAVPAYRYLPDSGKVAESELDRAVRASGADALLMTRIRSIDRRTTVSETMVPMHQLGPGWYGLYSGWYPVADVRQYDIALVETTLFDAASRRVVWSGVTETYEPRSVRQDAPGFAEVIVKALAANGLLPARR